MSNGTFLGITEIPSEMVHNWCFYKSRRRILFPELFFFNAKLHTVFLGIKEVLN